MTAPHIDLDRLEALANAATPGPWTSESVMPAGSVGSVSWAESEGRIINGPPQTIERDTLSARWFTRKQDGDFIAAANPAVVQELVARLRRAEADAAWMRGVVDAARQNQKEMLERAERAEAQLAACSPSNREGELSIVMSMHQGGSVFVTGRHVAPEQLRSFASGAVDHVRMESDRAYRQLQDHIAGATPNDPLDDVLPLRPVRMPDNLPASLDLTDTEGGAHD